ncbi:hypothetical protein FRC03_001685 [Tulasnella sp. 419]|nr:hypothetical protein FRC03_001685 [Tulasnella sp. 419]
MSQASYVACLQHQFQFKVGHLFLPLLKQRPFPFDDGGMPDPPGDIIHHLEYQIPEDHEWLRHVDSIIIEGDVTGVANLYKYSGAIQVLAHHPPPCSGGGVHEVMTSDDMWLNIFLGGPGCGHTVIINDVENLVRDNGRITEEREEHFIGNDNMDPISSWTIEGAPNEMQQ